MSNFSRKYDYKDEFYNELFEIHKKYKDILFVANESYVKGYYNGLVLFSRFGVRTINFVDNKNLHSILTDYNNIGNAGKRTKEINWILQNTESIKKMMKDWMPRDKERRSSQRIALKNMTFEDFEFSVCGWETTIPKTVGCHKKPEIDLVVVNPLAYEMYFVEYKCTKDSITNKSGFKQHLNDYINVLCRQDIGYIKKELLKAYYVMRRIYTDNNSMLSNEQIAYEARKYKVKIGFLFVDKSLFDENANHCIGINDYKNCLKDYNQYVQNLGEGNDEKKKIAEDIIYWRFNSEDDVNFKNAKSIRNLNEEQ